MPAPPSSPPHSLRHPCTPSVIPAPSSPPHSPPSSLHPLRHPCTPSVIPAPPPSSLHPSVIPAPFRHACAPVILSPSVMPAPPRHPRTPSVIPAHPASPPHPLRHPRTPSVIPAPPPSSPHPSVIPASPSFLRRQESMRPPDARSRPRPSTAHGSTRRRGHPIGVSQRWSAVERRSPTRYPSERVDSCLRRNPRKGCRGDAGRGNNRRCEGSRRAPDSAQLESAAMHGLRSER